MKSKKLFKLLKLMRPKQWIKNFAVFAAVVFTGELFNTNALFPTMWGFVAFCILSSSIYIVNDILDVEKDRIHPFKRFRPLANKDFSIKFGFFFAAFLSLLALVLSSLITPAFFFLMLVYLGLQLSYSLFLKHIEILDILALAAGYILRVYGGELASGQHISVWLILTTVSLSLFLAVGKRRSELTLISGLSERQIEATRKTLSHYSERLLDVYLAIFTTATFMFYALFTFLESASGFKITLSVLMPEFLPAFFQRKWLMITILPVIYGLMRYLQDIYEKHEGESPEKVFLSDRPLLICVLLWAVLVIGVIYFVRG